MGPGLTLIFFKSSQNSSKPVLIFWSSRHIGPLQCVFCLYIYTLLIVVNYYDLSVLSMSVMCFQIKVWMEMGGWVGGWGELHPSLFWIFGIFVTLQSP